MPRGLSLSLVAGLIALAGCGHTPPMSLWKLSQVDASTVDIASLRAAVLVPDALRPRIVTLVLSAPAQSGSAPRTETFVLQRVEEAHELAKLEDETVPGSQHYIYRVGTADVGRIEKFRADVAAFRAAGGSSGGGKLSLGAQACRVGLLPPGPLLLTTYLKFESDGEYVPLARNIDLRTYDDGQALLAKLPRCT